MTLETLSAPVAPDVHILTSEEFQTLMHARPVSVALMLAKLNQDQQQTGRGVQITQEQRQEIVQRFDEEGQWQQAYTFQEASPLARMHNQFIQGFMMSEAAPIAQQVASAEMFYTLLDNFHAAPH